MLLSCFVGHSVDSGLYIPEKVTLNDLMGKLMNFWITKGGGGDRFQNIYPFKYENTKTLVLNDFLISCPIQRAEQAQTFPPTNRTEKSGTGFRSCD